MQVVPSNTQNLEEVLFPLSTQTLAVSSSAKSTTTGQAKHVALARSNAPAALSEEAKLANEALQSLMKLKVFILFRFILFYFL